MNTWKKLYHYYQNRIRPRIWRGYIRFRTLEWKKIDPRRVQQGDVEHYFRKALRSPYLYLSLGLMVGLLFTVQFRNESQRSLNPVLFYNELVDAKGDFFTKQEELNKKIKELRQKIATQEQSLAQKNIVSRATIQELTTQELLLGLHDVSGGGVVVTLADGQNQVKDQFSKSLTHAADLRDILNLLWYAGAEAISINGERIIYNTSIDSIVSTVMINTTNYASPFTIFAIGSTQDIYNTIIQSRKADEIQKRVAKHQVEFNVSINNTLRINAYTGVYTTGS